MILYICYIVHCYVLHYIVCISVFHIHHITRAKDDLDLLFQHSDNLFIKLPDAVYNIRLSRR